MSSNSPNRELRPEAVPFVPAYVVERRARTGMSNGANQHRDVRPPKIKVKPEGLANLPQCRSPAHRHLYEMLDAVPFTPGNGVCTPSPTNWAALHHPGPFAHSHGSPMSETRWYLPSTIPVFSGTSSNSPQTPGAQHNLGRGSPHHSTSPDRMPTGYLGSPGSPLGQRPVTYSYSPDPTLPPPYANGSWSMPYPPSAIHGGPHIQPWGSPPQMPGYPVPVTHAQVLIPPLAPPGYCSPIPQPRTDAQEDHARNNASKVPGNSQGWPTVSLADRKTKGKSQQCPEVSPAGELRLNARQRRTLRRAQERLLAAFQKVHQVARKEDEGSPSGSGNDGDLS